MTGLASAGAGAVVFRLVICRFYTPNHVMTLCKFALNHHDMLPISQKFKNVDDYISAFPPSTQAILQELRATIKKAAPKAEEVISYNMPGYKLNGMLVWYAGYKSHIGFYPKPSGLQTFQKELAGYKSSKGAVQFPIDQPMPLHLVTKIVKFRIKENAAAADKKK